MRADLDYAWRGLRRSPAFSASATLTLALGVGISLGLVVAGRAALFTPLPYTSPGRLVHVSMLSQPDGRPIPASYPDYRDWRDRARTLSAIAGWSPSNRTLTGFGAPVRISATLVTANFFATLGVPVQGRAMRVIEERTGADRVAIVSHAFWRRYLGARPTAVGTMIRLGNVPYEVIGILPESFRFELDGADLFLPLGLTEVDETRRGSHWLRVIGRLGTGATRRSAEAELEAIARAAAPSPAPRLVSISSLRDEIAGNARQVLLVLLGAALFVTISASASVANLVSARAAARRREFAVRSALGATRGSLWQLAAMELVLVGTAAAALASLSSTWLVALAGRVLPPSVSPAISHLHSVRLDPFVAAAAAVLALLTLAPSFLVLTTELRRSTALRLTPDGRGVATTPLRRWLVAVQVGVALVMLIGAGLMARSVMRLQEVKLGFDPSRLVAVRLSVPPERYQSAEQVATFFDDVWRAVAELPGVDDAGVIDELPLTKDTGLTRVSRVPQRQAELPEVESVFRSAGPGYFETMGIAVLGGRAVMAQDNLTRPAIAVINRTLADRLFGSPDGAVGRQITFGPRGVYEVVGVVGDVTMGEPDREIRPAVYTSALQNPSRSSNLVVRTALAPGLLLPAVRDIVAGIDPEVPVYSARTLTAIRGETRAYAVRAAVLYPFAGFGVLTVVVAAIGVHGLLHYLVVQRRREFAIRMALGATHRDVVRLALVRGLVPVFPGIAAGLLAAALGSRILASLLFGTGPLDAAVFAGTAAGVLGIAALACYLPARRVARLNPAAALSTE